MLVTGIGTRMFGHGTTAVIAVACHGQLLYTSDDSGHVKQVTAHPCVLAADWLGDAVGSDDRSTATADRTFGRLRRLHGTLTHPAHPLSTVQLSVGPTQQPTPHTTPRAQVPSCSAVWLQLATESELFLGLGGRERTVYVCCTSSRAKQLAVSLPHRLEQYRHRWVVWWAGADGPLIGGDLSGAQGQHVVQRSTRLHCNSGRKHTLPLLTV